MFIKVIVFFSVHSSGVGWGHIILYPNECIFGGFSEGFRGAPKLITRVFGGVKLIRNATIYTESSVKVNHTFRNYTHNYSSHQSTLHQDITDMYWYSTCVDIRKIHKY